MNKVDTCANRIRKRLEELNMTQADLCKYTGINKATVSQYLSGKYLPKQDKIEAIAKVLNVDVVWLMGYDIKGEALQKLVSDYNKYELSVIYDKLNDTGRAELIKYAKLLCNSDIYIAECDNVSKEA